MGGTKRQEKDVAVRGGDRGRSTPTTFPSRGRPLGVGVFLPPLHRGDRKVPPPDGWNEKARGGRRGPGRRSQKVYAKSLPSPGRPLGVGVFLPPLPRGDRKVPPPDGWNEEARGGRRGRGGDRRGSTPRAFHHPAGHWEWGTFLPPLSPGDRKVPPPDGWNEEARGGRRGRGGDRRGSTPRAFHHPAGHWEWGTFLPPLSPGDRKVPPPDGWNEEARGGRRGRGGDRRGSTPRAFHHPAGHWEWGFSYPHCLGGQESPPRWMERRGKGRTSRSGTKIAEGLRQQFSHHPAGHWEWGFSYPHCLGGQESPPPDGWNEEARGGRRGRGRGSQKVYANNFPITRPATGSGGFPTPTASGDRKVPPPDGWNEEAGGGRRGPGRRSGKVYTNNFSITRPATSVSRNSRPM